MAEIALSYVYGKPNHGRQINLRSIEVVNIPSNIIKLRFDGISGKLLAFGRPADFELRIGANDDPYVVSYRTDFDVNDPQTIIIKIHKPASENTKLVYGGGLNPYVNIIDEAGMCVPGFGPVDLPPAGEIFKFNN